MILYACVLGTINFGLLVCHFLLLLRHSNRKEATNRDILAALAAAEKRELEAEERERRVWDDVLPVVKAYKEGARIHHKEAGIAKEELGAKVDAATGEIVHKIEEMPERLREVVKADSGAFPKPPTGGS